MSKVSNNGNFTTKLKDKQFLKVIDNSNLGVIIIQRGYLRYYNKKFLTTFGYSEKEILNWKKFEYCKIIHPEDISRITSQMKINDDYKSLYAQFRGVTKDGRVIPIKNYICLIKYDNKSAFLSSYISVPDFSDNQVVPIYDNIKQLETNQLDLIYLICSFILKSIKTGKNLDYFKSITTKTQNMVNDIKEERLIIKEISPVFTRSIDTKSLSLRSIGEDLSIEIKLPNKFKQFLDYLSNNFFVSPEKYLKTIIEDEINSRISDLRLF